MAHPKDQSLVTCMLFAEILDYAKKPVAEQIKLSEGFNALLSEVLRDVAPGDRIVLDSGSGAAIAFLGKPEVALLAAMDLRDRAAAENSSTGSALPLRIGINIGPVKMVKEEGGEPNIVGDGITVAHSVMSFAAPGQIMVSQAYRDAVFRVAQDYAKLLESDGSRTDRYLREHSVYAVATTPASLDAAGQQAVSVTASDRNRNLRVGAAAAVAAILVIAVGVRAFRTKPAPPPEPAPPIAAAPAPMPQAAPVSLAESPAASPPVETKAPKKKAAKPKADVASVAAASSAPANPAPQPVQATPGLIEFAIAPWGEVYVDGAKRGVSPPMKEVQLAPGKHIIEIRNTTFPSYSTTVEVTSGAQSKIKYKFN